MSIALPSELIPPREGLLYQKLLIGGRTTQIEGFTNVDLYEGPEVDIRTDASNLSMIPTGTTEILYASHILEHFSHLKTLDVLKEWCRVLKQGGKAYISVPDFGRVVDLYLKHGLNDFVVNLTWGDQIYDLAY